MDGDEEYTLHDWVESLENIAYHCGYDLKSKSGYPSGSNVPILKLTPLEELMPQINARIVLDENNSCYYVQADIVKFPDLRYDDMQYHDSASHYISQWSQAGRLVDRFSQESYSL